MRVKRRAVWLKTVTVVALGLGVGNSFGQATRLENFDVDPEWTSVGSGSNSNDFGYRSNNVAGGTLGEGGGRFTRTAAFRHYGDTHLGGALTLDDPIMASGRFDYAASHTPDFGNGVWIGHYNTTEPIEAKLGMRFNDVTGTNYLNWTIGIRGDTGGDFSVSGLGPLLPGIDRTWSYSWDPDGGVHGAGRLTGTITGPGGGTLILDLTSLDRERTGTFDAFGFNSGYINDQSQSDYFADMYFDDLEYSSDDPLVPGDANGDGFVTGADYTIWADNFDDGVGPGGKTWRQGDFTGEGYVTGADYTIWADNYGAGVDLVMIPELPSSWLALASLLGLTIHYVRARPATHASPDARETRLG